MTNRARVFLPLLVAGCATAEPALPEGLEFAKDPRNPVPGTIVDTVPQGALLTYPDGTCRTPCRVDYGEKVVVTVGKEGYQAMRVTIPLGAADTVVELAPVGRTTEVEEASLPEL